MMVGHKCQTKLEDNTRTSSTCGRDTRVLVVDGRGSPFRQEKRYTLVIARKDKGRPSLDRLFLLTEVTDDLMASATKG